LHESSDLPINNDDLHLRIENLDYENEKILKSQLPGTDDPFLSLVHEHSNKESGLAYSLQQTTHTCSPVYGSPFNMTFSYPVSKQTFFQDVADLSKSCLPVDGIKQNISIDNGLAGKRFVQEPLPELPGNEEPCVKSKKLERNRKCAKESRMRKKEYIFSLEAQVYFDKD
jgi:hypothetical protein